MVHSKSYSQFVVFALWWVVANLFHGIVGINLFHIYITIRVIKKLIIKIRSIVCFVYNVSLKELPIDKLIYRPWYRISGKNTLFPTIAFMYFAIFRQMNAFYYKHYFCIKFNSVLFTKRLKSLIRFIITQQKLINNIKQHTGLAIRSNHAVKKKKSFQLVYWVKCRNFT